MDGVIIDSEHLWTEAQIILLRRRNKEYDPNIKPKQIGRSQIEAVTILAQHHGLDEPIEALSRERLDIIRKLYGEVNFMPGFQELLEQAKALDYKRAIATGSPQELFNVVNAKLKLEERVGLCITVDRVMRAKPHPDIFLLAASEIGVAPQQCVVVEDAPNGILAAKAAGMYAIGIAGTVSREQLLQADEIVTNFSEIDLRKLRTYSRT